MIVTSLRGDSFYVPLMYMHTYKHICCLFFIVLWHREMNSSNRKWARCGETSFIPGISGTHSPLSGRLNATTSRMGPALALWCDEELSNPKQKRFVLLVIRTRTGYLSNPLSSSLNSCSQTKQAIEWWTMSQSIWCHCQKMRALTPIYMVNTMVADHLVALGAKGSADTCHFSRNIPVTEDLLYFQCVHGWVSAYRSLSLLMEKK